jgi:hypothetical protein
MQSAEKAAFLSTAVSRQGIGIITTVKVKVKFILVQALRLCTEPHGP